MRFLVIGCGSIGKRHIGNLLQLQVGEVIAYDPRVDRRKEAGDLHKIETFDDLDAAFDADPLAALITAPNRMHIELATKAARRGCHLFIEKPLSDSLDGVQGLIDEVAKRNLVTLIGCNMRFHPVLQKIKSFIDEGTIGRVISARAEFGQYLPDWHPWEDYRQGYSARKDLGGGIILDAIHELDYVTWMLGDVQSVTCTSGTLGDLEINTEDIAVITAKLRTGAIVVFHLDYLQRAYSRGLKVIGTEGTIEWETQHGLKLYAASTRAWTELGTVPGWRPNDMYVNEMEHFVSCLQNKATPMSDVSRGKVMLELALAAKYSAFNQTSVLL